MPRYSAVSARAGFPEAELEILDLWQRTHVFERSLAMRRDAPPYVFYEGPPTANGLPGLHHVLARSYKDVFARYKQMTGYSVARKAGWDTHGLPVELEVERALKISGKQQIEEYGIAEFNARCKASVNEYIDQWREMSERLGFWLDFDHPYRTYDGTYIESVWWSLKELWEREMLYQGYKVTPYCPRCQTTLSSHELSQGYREDTPDPSVYVKFRLNDSDGTTFLLAWTTTPWTLPGNVALAVHSGKPYVRVAQGDESYILAKERLSVLDGDYEILDEMDGADLVDLTYEPLFTDMIPEGLAFVVLDAPELVSMDEGTGIVHTAAAYGVADLELCQRRGIAIRHVVGLDGRFLDGQTRYRGMFVKDADPQIIEDLREQGSLYRAERILHTYPFCWRCDTPLLYYAITSWFIRTTTVKNRLLAHNRSVHWQPAHIRDGRMGNWLESLIDWNLSRTRYWGTPLPIWVCDDCDQKFCAGSAADVGLSVEDDLHRPFIDDVTLPCAACNGVMHRVPDVIDAWYDSGAMPFAQKHYPFENRELFEQTHPADFICEGVDQTRGWFFSLLAESTLLFDLPAYRNCVVVGTLQDKQGKKMSKSRGNTIEPSTIFDQFGADAARWYFYAQGVENAELRVSPTSFQDVVRLFMLTLWNVYSFFVTYALTDEYDPASAAPAVIERPVLDRWCLARLAETVDAVREAMERYDASDAVKAVEGFVEDLSKWYVRRSRRRFWKSAGTSDDSLAAFATLQTVLLTLAGLMAPFMPFMAERMYRNLTGFNGDPPSARGAPDSVHLTDYPKVAGAWRDSEVLVEMSRLRRLVEDGLAARTTAGVRVRQPLASANIASDPLDPELEAIFMEELNVKSVGYVDPAGGHALVVLDTAITDELRLEWLAREVSRKVNDLRKQAGLRVEDRITLLVDAEGDARRAVDAYRDWLQAETL
ncbi:MAG TPA: isoleucine--tRNA ligase, partial [Candidatus Dormibacteraeota bacterium]|nr:isoleucine--tRNA ligase [Candidatus Dormibacteraeota bacterium]